MKTTKSKHYADSYNTAYKACRDAQNALRRYKNQMPAELHLELYCLTVSLQEAMCEAWSKLEDERLKFACKSRAA